MVVQAKRAAADGSETAEVKDARLPSVDRSTVMNYFDLATGAYEYANLAHLMLHRRVRNPLTVSDRTVRIVRWSLLAFVAIVLALVFAVPRVPPPAPSLAQPEQAFVDRAGIVKPAFAREWAGALLNDDRAQIVVYVDRNLPEGNLAAWATQTATDWKIGTARNDTGVAIFVFTEPRLARIEVGYGLEGVIPDARARQLLEAHVAPAFAQGRARARLRRPDFAIRKEIGGDDAESIHRRAAEGRKAQVPWYKEIGTAFARAARGSFRPPSRISAKAAQGHASRSSSSLAWA